MRDEGLEFWVQGLGCMGLPFGVYGVTMGARGGSCARRGTTRGSAPTPAPPVFVKLLYRSVCKVVSYKVVTGAPTSIARAEHARRLSSGPTATSPMVSRGPTNETAAPNSDSTPPHLRFRERIY